MDSDVYPNQVPPGFIGPVQPWTQPGPWDNTVANNPTNIPQHRGVTPPGYNYLGPGNTMHLGPPTNVLDHAAYVHDQGYEAAEAAGENPYFQDADIGAAADQDLLDNIPPRPARVADAGIWANSRMRIADEGWAEVARSFFTAKRVTRPVGRAVERAVNTMVSSNRMEYGGHSNTFKKALLDLMIAKARLVYDQTTGHVSANPQDEDPLLHGIMEEFRNTAYNFMPGAAMVALRRAGEIRAAIRAARRHESDTNPQGGG